jgi:hypothetical protein
MFLSGFDRGLAAFGGVLAFVLGCVAVLAVMVIISTIIAMFHHDSEDEPDE